MSDDEAKESGKLPWYQDVDGFRLPGLFLPEMFRSALKYEPIPGDLFIVTYPKCGTTWAQEIVASIYRNGKRFASLLEFVIQNPFLEFSGAEAVVKMTRPSAIKVHLPFHLTPYSKEAKYIFVTRNPKDCCVSFYYHTKNNPLYKFENGTFDEFFEIFLRGETDFGDYFDTLLSWYEHRHDDNVLFLTYEQLKKDTRKEVLKIAEFMGSHYRDTLETNEDLLSMILKNSSLDVMKDLHNKGMEEFIEHFDEHLEKNPDIPEVLKIMVSFSKNMPKDPNRKPDLAQFIRKGVVGDWRNHFTEEQSNRLIAKFEERTRGTDIPKLWEDYI